MFATYESFGLSFLATTRDCDVSASLGSRPHSQRQRILNRGIEMLKGGQHPNDAVRPRPQRTPIGRIKVRGLAAAEYFNTVNSVCATTLFSRSESTNLEVTVCDLEMRSCVLRVNRPAISFGRVIAAPSISKTEI